MRSPFPLGLFFALGTHLQTIARWIGRVPGLQASSPTDALPRSGILARSISRAAAA